MLSIILFKLSGLKVKSDSILTVHEYIQKHFNTIINEF